MTVRKAETPSVILVGGPTASGKSAFALDLAQRVPALIVNADAMQVYTDLPILTNQPSLAERAAVPHALYEVTSPDQPSSAGHWLRQAQATIAAAHAEGRIPILVGGTGLYFAALQNGLAEIPPVPDTVRDATAALYDALGEAAFRAALALLDAEAAARIARNDRQRLLRAYDVAIHTGRSLTDWQRAPAQPAAAYRFERHVLMPPRDALYACCDRRFLTMIEQGAVAEVAAFLAKFGEAALSPARPASKVIGVREIAAFLAGTVSLDQAIKTAQMMTRRYAKRQMTWFRNQWCD